MQSARTVRRPPTLFIVGACIATLSSVAGWLLAPIEARFISTLTEEPFMVGVAYAVGTASFAVLALFTGRFADRFGRGRVTVLALGIGVLYPLLYASSINVLAYMGIKVLWACAAVGTGPVLLALLQDLVADRSDRGHLLSLMYGAMALSGAVGHYVGGAVASQFGLTAPYYVLACVYVLVLFIALPTLLRRSANQHYHHILSEQETLGLDPSSILFGFRYVFKKPILVYYFILNTAFSMNYGIKVLLWPLIVLTLVEDPYVMGVIFAATGVTAFFVLMFSGKIIDRKGVFYGIHLSWFALLSGGALMAATNSYLWFGVGAVLFAVGEAFYGSAQAVLLTDHVASKHRGELLGIDRIFDSAFITLAMLLSGALIGAWDAQRAWLLFMAVLAVAYLGASIYAARHDGFNVRSA